MDGGEAYQLTTSKEAITGFAWSKDGHRIALLAVDAAEGRRRQAPCDDPQVFEAVQVVACMGRGRGVEEATETVRRNFTVKVRRPGHPTARVAYAASPTTLLRETRTDAYVVSPTNATNTSPRRPTCGAPRRGRPMLTARLHHASTEPQRGPTASPTYDR
jgi:hypothetical protein